MVKKIIIFLIIFHFGTLLKAEFFIKGVHYWGNAGPFNFWDSIELKNVETDFNYFKKRGFNTIILVVPWVEFQLYIYKPYFFNKFALDKLNFLLKEAEKFNFKVILRLSYTWDLFPKYDISCSRRFFMLYYDKNVLKAWKIYLKKIYEISSKYKNFLFGFLTWEDFWGFINVCRLQTQKDRKKIAKLIGYPYPVPKINTPEFENFLKFWDKIIIERIFNSAKDVFPDLSFEIRIDKDPIYRDGKLIKWFEHKDFFNMKLKVVTIYYAPFWGAKNNFNYISGEKALERLKFLLNYVKNNIGKRKIFIDQFNFYDNSPLNFGKTIIYPGDLSFFYKKAIKVLKSNTIGFALWNTRRHECSVVYNGFFENGLDGWEKSGKVSVIYFKNDKKILISSGGEISQFIPEKNLKIGLFSPKYKIYLCYEGIGLDKDNELIVNGKRIYLTNFYKNYCIKLAYKQNIKINFVCKKGKLIIDKVKLYSHVQEELNLEKIN